ncbi:Shikimate kinase I [hydrothermal vent metagenome]|uniref:Shikimate kinase I n=1 Tax=hydrothermal vent metagenome TaxID=652676 RepID=A0A3B0V583_9ZZZZ
MSVTRQKQNIVLTGFMGTGKTTVGRLLAEALGFDFVDTDGVIEARNGRSITTIFSEQGEAAFRQMERDLAQELGQKEGLVISTGGRMMLDPENVQALAANGRIFCLVAAPENILLRVQNDEKVMERPLLKGSNPMAKIIALLQERWEQYQQFPQIMTDNKTPEEVLQTIVDVLI